MSIAQSDLETAKKGKGWIPHPATWLKGSGSDKKKKEEEVAKAQAKGTGYSSYSHKGWDIKAYQAAQKEKDKQIQVRLIYISQGYIDGVLHVCISARGISMKSYMCIILSWCWRRSAES